MPGPYQDIHDHDTGAFGCWDQERWRIKYKTTDEWLPLRTTREQAAVFVKLISKVYEDGYDDALATVRATLRIQERL